MAGFIVIPVRPPSIGMVISTLVGVAGLPSTLSLWSTSTSPPLATCVSGSSFASIVWLVSEVTVILATAVSQVLGSLNKHIL